MHQTSKHTVYVLNTLLQRNHQLSIICCSYFDLWRQRRKMRVLYRCSTLELNRMPILSSVVHQVCWHALYVVMTLRLSDHHSHLNSAERYGCKIKSSKETRSWTEICIYHSLGKIISYRLAFAFRSSTGALAAGLPRQGHVYKTTDESIRFHNQNFDKMRCILDSTENPRSFEKYPTPP